MLLRPFHPRLTASTLGLGISATALHLHLHRQQRPLLCEPSSPLDQITQQYLPTNSTVPSRTQGGKQNNTTAEIIRQLSLGSVVGVLGGAAVSTFSRVLAVLIGLGVVVVQVCLVGIMHEFVCQAESGMLTWRQYAASYGYNIVPTSRIQRYVKGIDLKRAVEENPAFKLSFGVTFALASMAKF